MAMLPLLAGDALPAAVMILQNALRSKEPGITAGAADLWQRIVDAIPATDPEMPKMLANLAAALQARFELIGDLADLDAAIEAERTALSAHGLGQDERPILLNNLGIGLRNRFERTGVEADLTGAISAGRMAFDTVPADDSTRIGIMNELQRSLLAKLSVSDRLADLDVVIGGFRDLVKAGLGDSIDQAIRQLSLGTALLQRFFHTDSLSDLDAAVTSLENSVNTAPPSYPQISEILSGLALGLLARSRRTGATTDADAAIEVARSAYDATPMGLPERARRMSMVAEALLVRFRRNGQNGDIEAAIEAAQSAIAAMPDDYRARASCMSVLGVCFLARFEHYGSKGDLEAAVQNLRIASEVASNDDSERCDYLSNLSNALMIRFMFSGEVADLDGAVDASRVAVQAIGDRRGRWRQLSNLASALHTRFERFGALPDLEDAIQARQEAMDIVPRDHPGLAMLLSNQGGSLLLRFQRTDDSADLEAAIQAGQAAVEATPIDDPSRGRHLTNLGATLMIKFLVTGMEIDLDAAIEIEREAAEAVPEGHRDRPGCLSNLAATLATRFERTRALKDLDDAINVGRTAVSIMPASHEHAVASTSNLARALLERFEITGALSDREAAYSFLVEASQITSGRPSKRIDAARNAASLAALSEPSQAADLLESAVRLLPEVAPRRLGRGEQQYAIGETSGLASEAAAFALSDTTPGLTSRERATRALRMLEAGRAVLLSQALSTRDELSDLRLSRPDLAQRFVSLRDQLDREDDSFLTSQISVARELRQHALTTESRRSLADQLATIFTDIRSVEGFATFGLPPTTDELLSQATSGPIVTFNISEHRSDALLLTESGIISVELPGLVYDSLIAQINVFHRALDSATASANSTDRITSQRSLLRVLEWLWDVAAEPVLDALGYQQSPSSSAEWPRVWWAPGGLLGLLPIHAAGYHLEPPANGQSHRAVMDRVISSYTPTIRALRYTRQQVPTDATAITLIVAMPTTPGLAGRLRQVPTEVSMLHDRLPRPVLLAEPGVLGTGLSIAPAGVPAKANVLAYLPDCRIAHFACHGASDPADPSKSLLLLDDYRTDPFTVASLGPVKLDLAELAYLSACSTAFTSASDLLDEAIHLTSAFQLAGFPHVVGTLWEIDDTVAVSVAEAFYSHLHTTVGSVDTSKAAQALHHAVRAVRHSLPGTPSLWAAHIHAGA